MGNAELGISESADVFDGVASLADKSLLRQVEAADGESRFVMLETIREYALERLDQCGETSALSRIHAYYYLKVAEAMRASNPDSQAEANHTKAGGRVRQLACSPRMELEQWS